MPAAEPIPEAAASSVAVLGQLRETQPEAFHELVGWLAAALVKDQYARLNEGGHSPDHRIRLAEVFVDLAAGSADPEPDDPSAPPRRGVVASLLAVQPSHPPRRESAAEEAPAPRIHARRKAPSHRVLIAGPGQGKSTVVQYLSQIHRLALLRPWRDALEKGARDALDRLDTLRAAQRLPDPREACLPLFVPLNRFAAWLAREPPESRSIERFVSCHARDTFSLPLSVTSIELALARLPWLLVLDGLDEVPDTADRQRALDAVDRFLEGRARARCVVVATTRPQSYRGELGWLDAETLCDMSTHRALAYARNVVARRYETDGERRRQIEERLVHASREPATARLMRTPLQVTIMTALLAESARPPVERWRLFREFYNVVVRRESDRDDGVAAVLSKFRIHLDTVHERVGLLLQVDCERGGGSDASLDHARFLEVVEQRLSEEGYARTEAASLALELARIAEDRLVFLTGVRAGRVGFELRSFQEFMAAEALFNGRESAVLDRVRVIARSSAWNNVLLFMASRTMATSSSLRDALTLDLFRWLDDPKVDPTLACVRKGAQLALDLLDEGALVSSPGLLRDVTLHALGLLEVPPAPLVGRLGATLARLCRDPETRGHVEPVVMGRLVESLSGRRPDDAQAAWVVALVLADADVVAARDLVDRAWPGDVSGERTILAALQRVTNLRSRSVRERLPALVPRHPSFLWMDQVDETTWCSSWVDTSMNGQLVLPRFIASVERGNYRIRKVGFKRLLGLPDAYGALPYWSVATAASRFEDEPSAALLADAMTRFGDHFDANMCARMVGEGNLSWVLEACVRSAERADDFRALAVRAEVGALGDLKDWRAAEGRWSSGGITEEDLVDFIDHGGLPHHEMDERGAAFGLLIPWGNDSPLVDTLVALVRLQRRATGSVRTFLVDLVLRVAASVYATEEMLPEPLSIDDLGRLAQEHSGVSVEAALALVGAGGDQAVRAALALISQQRRFSVYHAYLRPQPIADIIIHEIHTSPESRNLLRILGLLPVADQAMEAVHADIATLQSDDGVQVEAALLALEVHRGNLSVDRAAAIGSRLVQLSTPEYWACTSVLRILEMRKDILADSEVALLRAILKESANELIYQHATAFDLLKNHVDRLTTTITAPETWQALRLPHPAPPPSTPAASERATAPDVPVHLHEIEIQGLRCYAALSMKDLHVEPERGQWIFVLGENGAGKTTLLRGLAMALGGQEVGDLATGTTVAPYRRPGTQRATVDVRTPAVYQASVEGENGHERFVVPSSPDTERPFLVAYGCRRGSALGGPDRALDFSRLAAIRTLFDDPQAGLVHAEQWLMNLHHGAVAENPPNGARDLLEAVLGVVAQLLPHVERPTVDENGVWVEGAATGGVAVRLEAMSDGYLTSLGWVIDMMARWIKQRRDAGDKILPGFHEAMTGVVLLDELDLHLHPHWQVRVVRDLKHIFKRMTFVVTTHNPMTLVGAHRREIWALRRDADGGMIAERHDTDPRLRTGSELYARFFGVEELYPHDLGSKLRRYGFLASSPYRTDDEERDVLALRDELRREGIDPGFEPASREQP